ncbi:MAG: hypothetical protein DELT_01941 [Desulfovibrio sp.]
MTGTTRIRPTPRAVLFFALSVPLALFVITLFREAWYLSLYLPIIAIAAILMDFAMTLPAGKLACDLRVPPRLFVGQAGNITVNLAADYTKIMPVQAILELTGDADLPEPVTGGIVDGACVVKLPVTPRRRGRIAVEALWLRWRGPLGLIEHVRRLEVAEFIDVTPDVKGIHEAALQFFARDAVYGVKTQRLRGEGTEFDALCEYTQGMDTRFIDWKRSAKHRKLLCKEFQQERNHQVVLGFDTGHLMLEPIDGVPKLDHAIKAALLLGWISLHSGDLVGGCGFDARFRHYLKPGRGMPYFTQFQRFSSGLEYGTDETNFTLGLAELNSRLQRRALVVLFTEFVDTISAELLLESLHRMARRHLVVFVTLRDPTLIGLQNAEPRDFLSAAESVVAGDFLRERSIVLEKIARLGVHCLDAPAAGMSSALLNRYLMIKQRGLL